MNRAKAEHQEPAGGFTLVEILIALTIMSIAMSVVIAAFVATLRGWQKSGDFIDKLHHGDFVMEQLVSATRSAATSRNRPDMYGFWLEDSHEGEFPTDEVSFVTTGNEFLPRDSVFANAMHRIFIGIGKNDDGEAGVSVRVMPHLAELEDWEDEEGWVISTTVKGLECRVYNMQEEEWEDEWEDTNSIPSLVEYTLSMEPLEKHEDLVQISRVVEIPVAPAVDGAVAFEDEPEAEEAGQEAGGNAGEGREEATPQAIVNGAGMEETIRRPRENDK